MCYSLALLLPSPPVGEGGERSSPGEGEPSTTSTIISMTARDRIRMSLFQKRKTRNPLPRIPSPVRLRRPPSPTRGEGRKSVCPSEADNAHEVAGIIIRSLFYFPLPLWERVVSGARRVRGTPPQRQQSFP